MAETKKFHLADVLSVISQRAVRPDGDLDGVHKLLNWMTGEDLYTHQIARATRECAGPLLAQHPDLANVGRVPSNPTPKQVEEWLEAQVKRFGRKLSVAKLPPGVRAKIDPATELADIRSGRYR